MTVVNSDEIEFLSIRDLANGLDQGIFTSSDLVKFFSEKISLEDGDFNSIAFPNPQAEDIAKRFGSLRVFAMKRELSGGRPNKIPKEGPVRSCIIV